MKFSISQQDLNTHLSLVSRAIPTRPTHPVLANVLLEASDNQIMLTGFDLSMGIVTTVDAAIQEPGRITLPAKLLIDIVSRLPGGDLEFNLEDEQVVLKTATGKYEIRWMGAEEYPELPIPEGNQSAILPVEALQEGLKATLFATSTDESKQMLTGVHIKAEGETLELAATNGHVLSTISTALESSADPFAVTVPAKALQELNRIIGNESGNFVKLHFDQGLLSCECPNDQRLTSRLLEGQYPNYRQLIPKSFVRQVMIDRKLLISALERIAVLAESKSNSVKLSTARELITLSVDAADVGSGREEIPAQVTGEDLEIAFNVKYLLDGLKAMHSSEVQMQANTEKSPVVLSPVGGSEMIYLVMPVQLKS